METTKVFIVHDVEGGWDCIEAVFDTWDKAVNFLVERRKCNREEVENQEDDRYYIHEKIVQ